MAFASIGEESPDEPFWSYLASGELRLPRCAACDARMWPAAWRCGACGGWDLVWEPVPLSGTLYAWTRSHAAFDRTAARSSEAPYVIGLVSVGGARLLGVLDGTPRIGAAVTGRILPPSPVSLGCPSIRWAA